MKALREMEEAKIGDSTASLSKMFIISLGFLIYLHTKNTNLRHHICNICIARFKAKDTAKAAFTSATSHKFRSLQATLLFVKMASN